MELRRLRGFAGASGTHRIKLMSKLDLNDQIQVQRLQMAQRRLAQIKDILAASATGTELARQRGSFRLELDCLAVAELGETILAAQRRLIDDLIEGSTATGAEDRIDAMAHELLAVIAVAEASIASEAADVDRLLDGGDGTSI